MSKFTRTLMTTATVALVSLASLAQSAPDYTRHAQRATGQTQLQLADPTAIPSRISPMAAGQSAFSQVTPFNGGIHAQKVASEEAADLKVPMLRGDLIACTAWPIGTDQAGIYNIPTDGSDPTPIYTNYAFGGNYVMGANMAGDTFRVTSMISMGSLFTIYQASFFNIDDETITPSTPGVDSMNNPSMIGPAIAEDPEDGTLYGCFYQAIANPNNPAMIGYQFGKMSDIRATTSTPISAIDEPWATCGFDSKGELYALTQAGILLKVDKTNGETEVVGNTKLRFQYQSSGVIDTKTDIMYYLALSNARGSVLYAIDLKTAKATPICTYTGTVQVLGLYIPKPLAEDKAPDVVSNIQANFDKGALQGNITFDMPTTLFDGTAATGTCEWGVRLYYAGSGFLYKEFSGEASYGSTLVTCPVSVSMPSIYKVVVFAKNSVGESPKQDITLWIGPDRPKAVENATAIYNKDAFTVEWSAVTEGEHADNDGYFDASKVTYKSPL